MKFWCNGCVQVFEAETESADFDQATCPSCQRDCIGFNLELEDARKRAFSDQVSSPFIGILFGGIASLFGFGSALGESELPPILKFADAHEEVAPFHLVESNSEAEIVRRKLGDEGVICDIVPRDNGKFEITVDTRDQKRARKTLGLSEQESE